ncbi:MAG: glycoside hydrolase family 16 protein, partial [Planctomycetales bacterium]|nr:glycoside hydrolase family 16 protein [Planctomycetales bacterium]
MLPRIFPPRECRRRVALLATVLSWQSLAILPLAAASSPASSAGLTYLTLFSEEFDGNLDIWREPHAAYGGVDVVDAGDFDLVRQGELEPGWRTRYYFGAANPHDGRSLFGNHEAEFYVDPWYQGIGSQPLGVNPFALKDGKLAISAAPASPQLVAQLPASIGSTTNVRELVEYTSGALTTQKLFATQYGYFEVRAKLPAGNGLWPAFWLLPLSEQWPPEIDVFEAHGQRRNQIHVNAILTEGDKTAGFSSTAGGWEGTNPSGSYQDVTVDFHTYGLDWNAASITWYFDGYEIARTVTPPSMHQEMYMLLNLAVGGPGSWPGEPNAATSFPAEMLIDYVRVFHLAGDFSDDGVVDANDLTRWEELWTSRLTSDDVLFDAGSAFLLWQSNAP